MDREEIEAKIRAIIAKLLEVEAEEIELDMVLRNQHASPGLAPEKVLKFDSLGVVELLTEIERMFDGIRITDEEWAALATVREVVDAVVLRLLKK